MKEITERILDLVGQHGPSVVYALVILVTGFVVTESIFAIPGLSKMRLDAITHRDYAVIQGMMIVVGTGFVAMNLVVDIIYAYIDPRIRY